MLVGVVSDTHNNLKNIRQIVSIFNERNVGSVFHTGDITTAKSLAEFSDLKCDLFLVYGNNDREESGLDKVAEKFGFHVQEPPMKIFMHNKNIAVFHEPELIDQFLKINVNIQLVLHGHTHRYRKENLDDTLIFNPGESAGMLSGKNAVGIVDLEDLSIQRIFF